MNAGSHPLAGERRVIDVGFEDWARHGDFVRRLARRLVCDEHAAEDLAQDAQLAALTRNRRESMGERDCRAWLASVVRNLSSNWRRGRRRRTEHERQGSVGRRAELDPALLSSRVELQQRMLAAVGELSEPYRTTIYLRFYEQLQPRHIADRQGVSVHTVTTRLQRGLRALRETLDRSGSMADWRAVLAAPIGAPPSASSSIGVAAIGGLALKSKLIGVAVAVTIIAVSLVLVAAGDERQPAPERNPVEQTRQPVEPRAAERVAEGVRESVPVPIEPRDAASSSAGDWVVFGRVVGADGTPIAGADVTAGVRPSPEQVETVTDDDGRYRVALQVPNGVSRWAQLSIHVTAEARNHRAASRDLYQLRAAGSRERDLEVDLRLEREPTVSGRILSADSLPGTAVPAPRTRVALVDRGGRKLHSVRVDRTGRFGFALPGTGPVWLVAGHARYGALVEGPIEVGTGEDVALGDLVLDGPGAIRGRVASPDGEPVAGIFVHARLVGERLTSGVDLAAWWSDSEALIGIPPRVAGSTNGTARTDEVGGFTFFGLAAGAYEIYFDLPGRETMAGGDEHSAGTFQVGEFAAITLAAHRVHVTVVDADGLAVPNARVWIERPGEGAVQTLAGGLAASSSFDAAPGDYVVAAAADGALPASRSISVLEDRYSYDVELVLDFAPRTGDIEFVAVDDAGARLRSMQVAFWRRGEDALLPLIRRETDAAGALRGIPVGDYRMQVRFLGGGSEGAGSRSVLLGTHFPVVAFAEVREGRRTEVELRAERGGRLSITFAAERGESDAAPVSIEIEDVGGSARQLYLTSPTDLGPTGGPELYVPRIGTEGHSGLVIPGHYTLRAKAAGFADFETRVHVKGGEITSARVELRRQ